MYVLENKEIYNLEEELNWLDEKNIYKKLKKIGVHRGQPAILAYIYMHRNCTQFEIARYLGLSRASVGVSVKRMVKNGYITIEQSENDRRSTCLNITKTGIKILVDSDMVLDEYVSDKFDGFTEEELTMYLRMLKKIKRNLTRVYRESISNK